ncbi:hypothetical protein JOB18_022791 [Solea senegalensis]|uniref:Uncharacterized protein n=1 Tax=Solea senegalensis TaxID=28829 RepID=A0AAV6PUX1_SOLSE|nr:hypothetical protein JOB18_022791 [Solea senegalensis]
MSAVVALSSSGEKRQEQEEGEERGGGCGGGGDVQADGGEDVQGSQRDLPLVSWENTPHS